MGSEWVLFLGLFLTGLSVFLLSRLFLSEKQEEQSLTWASGKEPDKSESKLIQISRPLVHKFCLGFAVKIKNPNYRKRIQKKIMSSGYHRSLNVDEFIGLQILWGFLLPAMVAFINLTLEMDLPYAMIPLLCPLGIFLPHFHLDSVIAQRRQQIVSDLPFFIDLFALSTEAGLDFVSAIKRIVERSDKSVLGEELGRTLEDITVGGDRAQAFKDLAARLDIPEITSFVVVMNDAEAQGQSISKVLKSQSIQMRLDRFTRAEKAGAKASQLILVPLMLFIIPAVLITVFGPVLLQFIGGNS